MTDVTPLNYIKHAMRTNSDTVGTYNVHPDLIHGALGLADELIELRQALDKCDRVNALEEIGDICWFVALINSVVSKKTAFFTVDNLGDVDPVSGIEIYAGEIISTVKRSFAYGKEPDFSYIFMCLSVIVEYASAMATKLNSSLDAALQLNINKLAARYPDKFTPDQANNRDTERERSVLEQNT